MATLSAHCLIGRVIMMAVLGLAGIDAARVLMFNSYIGNATKSHLFAMRKISKHLLSRGHDVTLAVSVHESTSSDDGEYVKFSSAFSSVEWHRLAEMYKFDSTQGTVNFPLMVRTFQTQPPECDAMLADEEFYNRLKKEHFDIAVVDTSFLCGFLYARRLGLKLIVLENCAHLSGVVDTIDPFPLSYVPVMFSELSDKMGFGERIYNTLVYYGVKMCGRIVTQRFNYLGQKYGITKGETVADIRSSVELFLLNNDFAFDFPRPMPSNVIMAGGIMTEPAKPLLPHFEQIVSDARSGAVVISFGSFKDIGAVPRLQAMVTKALSKLPQVIIWSTKYKPDHLHADNIMVYDWIPQNDLLGHPNVKVFVTHGGVNGLMEAFYHGVPMLVLPGGLDCNDNAVRIERKGVGLVIRPRDVTSDLIQSAVTELIVNKTYKSNAKRLSAIMRDRILSPVETASFWIEHVIRHGGANHLRPAGNDLSFVELNMLDVKLTFLVVILVIVYGMYNLYRYCSRQCESSPNNYKLKAN